MANNSTNPNKINTNTNILDNIKVVLIETSHPGNIGSTARAMKTMGLTKLTLVNPNIFPSDKADAMSAGAQDILENAVITKELDEAIQDCTLIIGASARDRSLVWPRLEVYNFAEYLIQHLSWQNDISKPGDTTKINKELTPNKVALLFGREKSGLSNAELHKCHYHLTIPANPIYPSLNLASAVQVLSYEIYKTLVYKTLNKDNDPSNLVELENQIEDIKTTHANKVIISLDDELASMRETEGLIKVFSNLINALDIFQRPNSDGVLGRLRRLFMRSHLEKREVNILRGILTSSVKKLSNTTQSR